MACALSGLFVGVLSFAYLKCHRLDQWPGTQYCPVRVEQDGAAPRSRRRVSGAGGAPWPPEDHFLQRALRLSLTAPCVGATELAGATLNFLPQSRTRCQTQVALGLDDRSALARTIPSAGFFCRALLLTRPV